MLIYNHAQPASPPTNRPPVPDYPQRLCSSVDRALPASGRPARAPRRDTGLATLGRAAWQTSQPSEVTDQATYREPAARLGLAPLWPLSADLGLCRAGTTGRGSARAGSAAGVPWSRREPCAMGGEA